MLTTSLRPQRDVSAARTFRRWTHRICGIFCAALALAIPAAHAQTPLIDLGPGLYQGYPGGLYPQGANRPPDAHARLVEQLQQALVPRAPDGTPHRAGAIGMVAVGMSNATQEFRVFEAREDLDPVRRGAVVLIDGAIGSRPSEIWADPSADVWTILEQRVRAAGLAPPQVQVAWIKLARGTVPDARFPAHALTLRDDLRSVVLELRRRYPNLRLAYLSSRSYGGYTTRVDRGEPLSYETGFAVKWLIERQIAGDAALNADPARGPVHAPALLWGPYLWANGSRPNGEGLFYLPEDYESDRIHPSDSGEAKIGARISAFFRTQPWYMRPDAQLGVAFMPTDDAWVDQIQPGANAAETASLRVRGGAGQQQRTLLRFDLSPLAGQEILRAKLALRPVQQSAPDLRPNVRKVAADWRESTLTYANAPVADPQGSLTGAAAFGGTAWALDVRSLLPTVPGATAFEVSIEDAQSLMFSSSEGPFTPYLLLTLRVPWYSAPTQPAIDLSPPAPAAPTQPAAEAVVHPRRARTEAPIRPRKR